jgi:hypothetical protein
MMPYRFQLAMNRKIKHWGAVIGGGFFEVVAEKILILVRINDTEIMSIILQNCVWLQ